MSLETTPLTDFFGVHVKGPIKLADINRKTADEIKKLLYKNKFILFKNQNLSEVEYIDFSRRIGNPIKFKQKNYHHPDHPEIYITSNMKKNGEKMGVDRVGYYWHSDSSFLEKPLPLTMLYSKSVPDEGGETAFIDMHHTYNQLTEELKNLISHKKVKFRAEKRYIITQSDIDLSLPELLCNIEKQYPAVTHPAVFKHPITNETILYISEGYAEEIIGLSAGENSIILEKIFEVTSKSKFTYKYSWDVGDVIIWDNRSVIHKAYPPHNKQSRMMYRIGIEDMGFF